MNEQVINNILVELIDKIPDWCTGIIRDILCIELAKYDIKPKCTEISCVIIPECYRLFIACRKIEGMSDKTLALYELYLNEFFRIIQKPIERLTANDIRMYLYLAQKTRKISNRTLEHRRIIVRGFLGWCAAEGYVERNPAVNIGPIKYERIEQVPLTDYQLEEIRSCLKDCREKAMVEVLYSTGCRVTELERLNIGDVNFETGVVQLFGKGYKHRKSYLNARALVALKQYLNERTDNEEALFVKMRKPYSRLHKAGIEKVIREIGARIGIEHLHPHLFRHTVATNCLKRGMELGQVQRLLGHASVNTTMIYAKIADSDVKKKHEMYII